MLWSSLSSADYPITDSPMYYLPMTYLPTLPTLPTYVLTYLTTYLPRRVMWKEYGIYLLLLSKLEEQWNPKKKLEIQITISWHIIEGRIIHHYLPSFPDQKSSTLDNSAAAAAAAAEYQSPLPKPNLGCDGSPMWLGYRIWTTYSWVIIVCLPYCVLVEMKVPTSN